MEIKDETYNNCVTTKAGNVSEDDIKYLIAIFLSDAAKDMGTDLKKETTDRVVYLVRNEFRYLPVCSIKSAITKGSLGDYGAGRLVPKTVFQWLKEMSVEYNREEKHKETEERFKSSGTPIDLKIYPMGMAINKKIDWLLSGVITSDEWDMMDLKTLAYSLGKGDNVKAENYIWR